MRGLARKAEVEIIRNRQKRKFKILLGELDEALLTSQGRPQKPKPKPQGDLHYGMKLQDLNADLRRRFNIPSDIKGVFISHIDP